MTMRASTMRTLFLTLSLLAATPALAAGEGRAVAVDPQAEAEAGAIRRVLEVGADVSVGERIATGPTGQVQLVFSDDTRLVVGPNSSLTIETYLMRGAGSVEAFAVNTLGGTFRFISGNSPSHAYEVRTPAATIGVRGTAFDYVATPGETRVMLYDGEVSVCTPEGACMELFERCDLGLAQGGDARAVPHADPARNPMVGAFRYASVQSPLLPPFRVARADSCLDPPEEPPAPEEDADERYTQYPYELDHTGPSLIKGGT